MINFEDGILKSKATIARLPLYLRYLRDRLSKGEENISSTFLAEDLGFNSVQVRKDLAVVSPVAGKPKLGFNISELIESIEAFLGCNNVNDAILAGAGGLGSTLLGYEGFKNYGLNITAAFDVSDSVLGKKINGVPVLGMDKLESTVKRLNIKMGIITVPKAHAQTVADLMVNSGIRAIWNFAPVHLSLPDNVAVKNEDLAASLALLSKKLRDVLSK